MKMEENVIDVHSMGYLREIGIDTSDASLARIVYWEGDDVAMDDEMDGERGTYTIYYDAHTKEVEDEENIEEYAVYTLADVINKLPKKLILDDISYYLIIGQYSIRYESTSKLLLHDENAYSQIQSAYNMLIWYHNFMKSEKGKEE